jgi:hypothetical protein
MDHETLVRAFEAGEEPPGGFHHAQNVRDAWWYLRSHPLPEALGRFTRSLKAFAVAQGKPTLYHETVTVAFMLVISERLAATGRDASWEAFAARNPDLFSWKPSVLERYYRDETLWSDRARASFVMPDRSIPVDLDLS